MLCMESWGKWQLACSSLLLSHMGSGAGPTVHGLELPSFSSSLVSLSGLLRGGAGVRRGNTRCTCRWLNTAPASGTASAVWGWTAMQPSILAQSSSKWTSSTHDITFRGSDGAFFTCVQLVDGPPSLPKHGSFWLI